MIVSIHQPQYLPWLPYFQKIDESDLFILLDTVDFQKNGLQNRNQIKTAQGTHWLTVPVRQSLGQKIQDVKIDNSINWRRKHWQTILMSYRKASAFNLYEEELESILSREWELLSELNFELMTLMLRYLNIQTPILKSSKMKAKGSASELVLNLCKEVGAKQYLSGTGGKNYLEHDIFDKADIEISYQSLVYPNTYKQTFPKIDFINNLSALDIILNCGDAWRSYLPEDVVTI